MLSTHTVKSVSTPEVQYRATVFANTSTHHKNIPKTVSCALMHTRIMSSCTTSKQEEQWMHRGRPLTATDQRAKASSHNRQPVRIVGYEVLHRHDRVIQRAGDCVPHDNDVRNNLPAQNTSTTALSHPVLHLPCPPTTLYWTLTILCVDPPFAQMLLLRVGSLALRSSGANQ